MAIIHVMGRPTADPVMQQGKNSGAEYVSLDIATAQRSQNPQNGQTQYETLYVTCYFSKYLAERLIKANVKKGTCLYLYGDVEIHPFLYSQGAKAGQPGTSIKMNVKDWQFCLSNKPETETAAIPQGNGMANNGGAMPPAVGGGQSPNLPTNGSMAAPAPLNAPMVNAAGMQGNSFPGAAMTGGMANRQPMFQPNGGMAGGVQMAYSAAPGNGFNSIPEGMAGSLPFNA